MRKPSTTIRVDVQSREELRRLAREYSRMWGRHVSLADLVRMGITLLAKAAERKDGESRWESSESSA